MLRGGAAPVHWAHFIQPVFVALAHPPGWHRVFPGLDSPCPASERGSGRGCGRGGRDCLCVLHAYRAAIPAPPPCREPEGYGRHTERRATGDRIGEIAAS